MEINKNHGNFKENFWNFGNFLNFGNFENRRWIPKSISNYSSFINFSFHQIKWWEKRRETEEEKKKEGKKIQPKQRKEKR